MFWIFAPMLDVLEQSNMDQEWQLRERDDQQKSENELWKLWEAGFVKMRVTSSKLWREFQLNHEICKTVGSPLVGNQQICAKPVSPKISGIMLHPKLQKVRHIYLARPRCYGWKDRIDEIASDVVVSNWMVRVWLLCPFWNGWGQEWRGTPAKNNWSSCNNKSLQKCHQWCLTSIAS